MGGREKSVAEWNRANGIGDTVAFYKDRASFRFEKKKTKSEAYIDIAGIPVVHLNGVASPVDLAAVKPWASREITLDEQIAFVTKELDRYRNVYPRLIKQGKVEIERAADNIAKMSAVLKTLHSFPVNKQLTLFEE